MPRFMDRHEVPGATAEEVAAAHARDVQLASKHRVVFFSYWFDPVEGIATCFAEAPGRDNMNALHVESHGMIPNEIIEVSEDTVLGFLGGVRRTLPDDGASPFRVIMFTDLEGSTELLSKVGEGDYLVLLSEHDLIIRRSLVRWKGREVKHTGDGVLASFQDAPNAVACALAINRAFAERTADGGAEPMRVRIGLEAGSPVDRNDDLFGTAVNTASRVCDAAPPGGILVTATVRQLAKPAGVSFDAGSLTPLKGIAEPVMLYRVTSGETLGG